MFKKAIQNPSKQISKQIKELQNQYKKILRIRPIFNFDKSSSKNKTSIHRYTSAFGHQYIHSFMLETQQVIISISSQILMEYSKSFNMSNNKRKQLKELYEKIEKFLIAEIFFFDSPKDFLKYISQ